MLCLFLKRLCLNDRTLDTLRRRIAQGSKVHRDLKAIGRKRFHHPRHDCIEPAHVSMHLRKLRA